MSNPTFNAVVDGDTCSFICPLCGKENIHGAINGSRASHCKCWDEYELVCVELPDPEKYK